MRPDSHLQAGEALGAAPLLQLHTRGPESAPAHELCAKAAVLALQNYGSLITVFTTVSTCVSTAKTHLTAVFPLAFDSYVRNDGVFTYHIN